MAQKPKGWVGEPRRHGQAARGIKTAKSKKRSKRPSIPGRHPPSRLGGWEDKSIPLTVIEHLGSVDTFDEGPPETFEEYMEGVITHKEETVIKVQERTYATGPRQPGMDWILRLQGHLTRVTGVPPDHTYHMKWNSNLSLEGMPGGPTTGYPIVANEIHEDLEDAKRSIDRAAKEFLKGRSLEEAAWAEQGTLERQHDMAIAVARMETGL